MQENNVTIIAIITVATENGFIFPDLLLLTHPTIPNITPAGHNPNNE